MQDMSLLNDKIMQESQIIGKILTEIERVIVGQRHLLERMMIAFITNGHILLEGVPGLAKTLSIKTLSQVLNLQFQRIQFTPDLLPADLTGTLIFDPKESKFYTKKGPIFTNLLLADEINRAPAKVQSALLEAMQEMQVTIGNETHKIASPFMVMATQNPIEQEGTYPLPEAQVDRFLMKVKISYPNKEEEKEIINRTTQKQFADVQKICTLEDIEKINKTYQMIYVDEKIKEYVVNIVFATRMQEQGNLKKLKNLIQFGASPRASIYLIQTAKALAFIKGRGFVTPEDVKMVARDVLRHRIILTYEAEAEEVSTDDIITDILDNIIVP
jgi:MoxR-like ATPase